MKNKQEKQEYESLLVRNDSESGLGGGLGGGSRAGAGSLVG